MMHGIVAAILILIGAMVAYFGRKSRAQADIFNQYVEASKPSELAEGVPGFFGGTVAVVPGQPALLTPYSKQPCVYSQYVEERYVERRQNDGTTSSGWEQVSSSQPNSVLFALQHADGQAFVNAHDAQVDDLPTQETELAAEKVEGLGGVGTVVNALNSLQGPQRRVTEYFIPVGLQLNAAGVVTEQNHVKTFAQDKRYPLMLTTASKASLVTGQKTKGYVLYAFGAALVAGGVAAFLLIKK